MATTIKALVSKKKQRYVEDGYNLDLSYINDRIIAMGFPAEKLEALFRNSMDEVKQFLDDKHAGHYMIYNLCSEKIYDKSKFDGRVRHYPFDDHHPPNFSLIDPFCKDVHNWLSQHEKNVAAVHCKAGKGRTGVMICCYLLYSQYNTDAQQVLEFYGKKRTMDEKGVTIPSQKRYVHYYDRLLRRNLEYKSVKLYLRCIVLDPVPTFKNIANDYLLSFVVSQRRRSRPYESKWFVMKKSDRQFRLEVDPPLLISDDVKIEFLTKIWGKAKKEFHFWLNTFFVDSEMDGGLAHDILLPSQQKPRESPQIGAEEKYNSNGKGDVEGKHIRFLDRRLSEAVCNNAPLITVESETDFDLPSHHHTVVSMASLFGPDVTSVKELMKQCSVEDESDTCRLLQQQTSASNASTSSSSSSLSLTGTYPDLCLPVPAAPSSPLTIPTTKMSFIEKRTRHASVPQTSSSPAAISHMMPHQTPTGQKLGHNSAQKSASQPLPTERPVSIEGVNMALRLNKSQIDVAAKDEGCKTYRENFSVTLFFLKPTDQSDSLVDYSQKESATTCCQAEPSRQISLTPVSLSSSANSVVACVENQKKQKKTSKHKSRISLIHFARKTGSSSDDEIEHTASGSDRKSKKIAKPAVAQNSEWV